MNNSVKNMSISPGRGLAWMTLGSSLHGVLTRLKTQPVTYPKIDLVYSATEPIQQPVIINLPLNGIRLRFDGPDQRLRLIEIVDFSKMTFSYKNVDLVKHTPSSNGRIDVSQGPTFRHLYSRLLGPSYAGEYIPPMDDDKNGTYVLSWPGFAARFSVKHESYSEKTNFVSILSSSAASAATSIAIFQGQSWPEVRDVLFVQVPNLPRSLALTGKNSDVVADEIEEVVIRNHKLELLRRTSRPFTIVLRETTPQDLVAELGPPDAIYKKTTADISVQADECTERFDDGQSRPDVNSEDDNATTGNSDAGEVIYNYFHHGLDVLVGPYDHTPGNLVASKAFLHGNIPGSYPFNRHRRCRWQLELGEHGDFEPLNSEMQFATVKETLREVFHDRYSGDEEEEKSLKGMVLNRGWDVTPDSSLELLGEFEPDPESKDVGGVAKNTELFGFPGLLFEVMANDAIVCLTVY